MRNFVLGALAFILIVLGGCSSQHTDPAPVIRPQQGAELCDEVCEKFRTMINEEGDAGCILAEPLPVKQGATIECFPDAGEIGCISCPEWCVEQHQNGIFWNTPCIMEGGVTECTQVETVCNIQ